MKLSTSRGMLVKRHQETNFTVSLFIILNRSTQTHPERKTHIQLFYIQAVSEAKKIHISLNEQTKKLNDGCFRLKTKDVEIKIQDGDRKKYFTERQSFSLYRARRHDRLILYCRSEIIWRFSHASLLNRFDC